MNEFLILILWLAVSKLLDTAFNFYQVKVQYDVEKQRIKNEQPPVDKDKQDTEREIGFVTYNGDPVEVEEDF